MKKIVAICFSFFMFSCVTKNVESTPEDQILQFQKELNEEYRNKKTTPLLKSQRESFKQHPFFPIDLKYRVRAKIKKIEIPQPFSMPTSSGKAKVYQQYGTANFVIDGKSYTLNIYQSIDLMQQAKYKDYLFLPFRDATNGKETYGGGKYLDLRIPKNDEIIIDFNQSYQPYCAYNAYDYNCPIVPAENTLPIEIRAGVMYEDIYFN